MDRQKPLSGKTALITGGAAGIWVLAKHSSLQSVCAHGCPSSDSGELSTYRTVANVSTAALIVAGVCAATGVTLLLSERGANPVSAYVGPTSAGIIGTF